MKVFFFFYQKGKFWIELNWMIDWSLIFIKWKVFIKKKRRKENKKKIFLFLQFVQFAKRAPPAVLLVASMVIFLKIKFLTVQSFPNAKKPMYGEEEEKIKSFIEKEFPSILPWKTFELFPIVVRLNEGQKRCCVIL